MFLLLLQSIRYRYRFFALLLCRYFAAIPLMRGFRVGDITAGAFFPMMVSISLPCIAGKIVTKGIAIRQTAAFAYGFFCTGGSATGVVDYIVLSITDRT